MYRSPLSGAVRALTLSSAVALGLWSCGGAGDGADGGTRTDASPPAAGARGAEPPADGARSAEPPAPAIVRLDPRFDALVPADAELERIADGFHWVEGPAWDRRRGYLLFSDVPANAIYRWDEATGTTLFLRPSGYTGIEPFRGREPGSNGLTFDPTDRLVVCEHGDRRITRIERSGEKTTLVDSYLGRRLNSPNDAVFRSNGDLYFTDPPFGLPDAFDDAAKQLPFSGVYRLTPDGGVTLLTDSIRAPNGIAFSPDEKLLYITDVHPERPAWLVYEVATDGTIRNGRLFRDAREWTHERPGGPDGLKVDERGNIYGAGPGGVFVFAPDGTHLGSFELGVPTGNVAWGEDGSTLFITASTAVYRVRLDVRGAGF